MLLMLLACPRIDNDVDGDVTCLFGNSINRSNPPFWIECGGVNEATNAVDGRSNTSNNNNACSNGSLDDDDEDEDDDWFGPIRLLLLDEAMMLTIPLLLRMRAG